MWQWTSLKPDYTHKADQKEQCRVFRNNLELEVRSPDINMDAFWVNYGLNGKNKGNKGRKKVETLE